MCSQSHREWMASPLGNADCHHTSLSKMGMPIIEAQPQAKCLLPLIWNQIAMPKPSLYWNDRAITNLSFKKTKKATMRRLHPEPILVFPVAEIKTPIQIGYWPSLWQRHSGVSYFILQVWNHNCDNNWEISASCLLDKSNEKLYAGPFLAWTSVKRGEKPFPSHRLI